MGRAVTFIGAADIPHCSGMVRFGKSDNVKVGGIGVSRQGDINTPHLIGFSLRPRTISSRDTPLTLITLYRTPGRSPID